MRADRKWGERNGEREMGDGTGKWDKKGKRRCGDGCGTLLFRDKLLLSDRATCALSCSRHDI